LWCREGDLNPYGPKPNAV